MVRKGVLLLGLDRDKKGSNSVQSQFTVGISVEGKGDRIVVRAEDALIAALKVKAERPEATITYVRRLNRRGDARHPPHRLTETRL
jgi:hypothetical protein